MKVYEVVSFWGCGVDNTHGMYSTKKLAEDAVAALLDQYDTIELSIIEHVVDSPKSETIWRNWED